MTGGCGSVEQRGRRRGGRHFRKRRQRRARRDWAAASAVAAARVERAAAVARRRRARRCSRSIELARWRRIASRARMSATAAVRRSTLALPTRRRRSSRPSRRSVTRPIPRAECAAGQPTADDGSRLRFSDQPGVTCLQGRCTTFVPDCGQPCDAGTTCFSCSNHSKGFAGAFTTMCTASPECCDPFAPPLPDGHVRKHGGDVLHRCGRRVRYQMRPAGTMRNVALRIVLFARPRDRAGRVRRMRSAANADGDSGFAGKGGSAAGGAGGAVGGAGGAVGGAGGAVGGAGGNAGGAGGNAGGAGGNTGGAGGKRRRRRKGGARRERGRRRGRRCGGRCGRTRRERRRSIQYACYQQGGSCLGDCTSPCPTGSHLATPSCPISESNAVCGGHCCLPTVASDGGSGDAGPSSYTCGAGSCTTGQTFCYSYLPGSPGLGARRLLA